MTRSRNTPPRRSTGTRASSGRALPAVLASILVIAAAGFGGYALSQMGSMHVLVNGEKTTLDTQATVAQAVETCGVSVGNGRLLAVDGSVIDEDGGEPGIYRVNGKPVTPETVLSEGDSLFLERGADTTEKTKKKRFPKTTYIASDGTLGAFHEVVDYDPDAEYEAEVGSVSEIPVEEFVEDSFQAGSLTRFSVKTDKKVIALTFDDGPWETTTGQILDILKDNGAKATFFVVGTCFDGDDAMTALVKREHDEGHLVCTHTYSHAADGGSNLGNMYADAQIDDVVHGNECIEAATGAPATKLMRAPGGNYSDDTAAILLPYISYDIGWDVDTNDWRKPGAEAIEASLLAVQPGDVVLMHDGGGDRSQTVEALRNALPKLKEDGWQFVTVEELLALA